MNAVLTHRKEIAKNTLEIGVTLSELFSFLPGQYVSLSIPELHDSTLGNGRDLSIVSSTDEETLRFVMRISESPFKQSLLAMPIGGALAVDGPFGFFILPRETKQPIVFLAGGIGIAAFMSMLYAIESSKQPYEIYLLYGNKEESSTAFLQELALFAKNIPHFSYQVIYAPIDANMIKKYIKNPAVTLWYIAGPPGMIASGQEMLSNIGVPHVAIRTELFCGYLDTRDIL